MTEGSLGFGKNMARCLVQFNSEKSDQMINVNAVVGRLLTALGHIHHSKVLSTTDRQWSPLFKALGDGVCRPPTVAKYF